MVQSRPAVDVTANGDWTVVLTDHSPTFGNVDDYAATSGGLVRLSDRGYLTARTEPTEAAFTQISVGDGYACGLTAEASVECWGTTPWYQNRPPRGEFVQVAAGDRHGCALDTDGAVRCWGNNLYGQTSAPEGVFTQIAAGNNYSCALSAEGTSTCWGTTSRPATPAGPGIVQLSEDGRCGLRADGTLTCAIAPNTFPGTFTTIGDLCGVRDDATVACWGAKPSELSAPPSGETFVQTSSLCGVTTGGSIECWGSGHYGHPNEPSDAPEGTFVQVSVGGHDACGLRADGSVKCWETVSTTNTALPGTIHPRATSAKCRSATTAPAR